MVTVEGGVANRKESQLELLTYTQVLNMWIIDRITKSQ